ncbi:hypothetical protein K1719_045402 [Acacia pycnantha]|nr:hypothetical protein K1719_045402 [Acacia pycnantha]
MGKKRDALFGRRAFNASKFKPLVNLAISRLAVLRIQRQARFKQARSDVLQLLQLGYHERALLRAEHVVKDQNLLDVYDKIEGYLNLLVERAHLIEEERECPEELKEAASGLLYASSRCGEFPELQEIRTVLTTRFGKEFAARAIELRNNCGVPIQIIQKLSTRMPSLENRMKALEEIASENNIVLQLDQVSSNIVEGPLNVKNENQHGPDRQEKGNIQILSNGGKDDQFSDSLEVKKKYKDVADAAQAAFESAAYAAAAARAAVELSRSESHDPPPNDHNTAEDGGGNSGEIMSKVVDKEIVPPLDDHNTHDDHHSNSGEIMPEVVDKKFVKENQVEEFNQSDSEDVKEAAVSVVAEVDAPPLKDEPVFDESESEAGHEHEGKQISSKSHDGEVAGFDSKDPISKADTGSKKQSPLSMNFEKFKKPFSVRTRRVWGF